ncbi:SusC/RagA family TonB-linked outer membrane protein [Gelidibacter japonicus]|uniref:SusC/RagA family TonB-linked outer membrane protein n=1 Tax=Gelidibacter japonicus TaxID=1962232 RepID=UPI003A941C64
MRTILFLFCTTVFGFSYDTSFSQVKIVIDVDKEVTIHEVFRIIKDQTDYRFIYPEAIFEMTPNVRLKKGTIQLNKLLMQSLSQDGFTFELRENNIIIAKKEDQLQSVTAKQQSQISGHVSDGSGVPLIGVNIIVKETSRGTQTDFDGNYKIMAAKGDVLIFSYVGFEDKEIVIRDVTVLNVSLVEATSALDEVFITAYGRTMTRNESTSSVVTVGSEEITKLKSTDATQALQGKVSGMTVGSTSGTPGSAPQIRIRGTNSVTASNEPLYVIDGMPVNSGNVQQDMYHSSVNIFALINPSDIESISVLKDASAVAPYGADGANGVILITTKTGSKGMAKYSLNMTSGFQNDAVRGPRRANAEQSYDIFKEALWNSFGSGQFGNGTIAIRDDLDTYAYNRFSQVRSWIDNGRHYADWYKETQNKNAFLGDVNFSMSKGSEDSNFYASLGYNKTESTMKGSEFKRWSTRIFYESNLSEKTNFSLSINAANASQDGIREGSALSTFSNPNSIRYGSSPWARIRNADGSYNTDTFNEVTSYANYPYIIEHDIRNNDVTRLIPTASLEYKIIDNLTFKTLFGIDFTLRYFKNYNNRHSGDGFSQNGKNNENALREYHYTTQNSLDYRITLNSKHNFNLTAIQEFNKYKTYNLDGYGENFPNDKLNNLSAVSKGLTTNSTFSNLAKLRLVGLLNYDFDKKYLANLSYSYQGDSRFSEQYGNFYSIGLGWNIHKESFSNAWKDINTLRLKGGYGLTGNAGIGRNEYQALVSYFRYNAEPAGIITGYGTEATWEKSHRLDLSVDYGLYNNRIKGSIGIFQNKTTDMLFHTPLSYTAQFTDGNAIRNAGEMKNNGFEINISGDIISTPDFHWNVGSNFTTIKNKVTSLPEDAEIIDFRAVVQEGRLLHEWYLPKWAGIDPENGLPLWYVDPTLNDETTSVYNQASRIYTGKSVDPKYFGSFSTRLEYKNTFFEAQFNFSGGNQIYDVRPDLVYRSTGSTAGYSIKAMENAWQNPGDIATFPRFDYNNTSVKDAGSDSTRFLHDADYIRLREIGIGYTFKNEQFLQALHLNTLSISLRASNIWTLVKDKTLEWDPEVLSNYFPGRRNFPTMPAQSFTFNINVNF